ncbi:NUMOD4 motif-containing HNH endonuclease [Mycobacterium sp. SMC-13]|uniref:NUMOD4 motif-containing HNH endonuclease n=1 Tax=Mycobacterium sp. SMC-13 TaxID=3381626 RepID=UPI00387712A3
MNATHEEWRPVVGYEGRYEVSDQGRVRSLDRVTVRSDGRATRYKGTMLKPSTARTPDYPVVALGGGASARVHNLVLEAFVGPRPPGMAACHGDGNHHNNTLGNLRWDTYSSNNRDLVRHNTHWQSRKTHCKHGHEFTPENTISRPEGGRKCHACSLINAERQRERMKTKGAQ